LLKEQNKMSKEERRFHASELRVVKTGKATKLCGYASVYNSDSRDLGGFTEQIAPGTFDAVLATNPDVRCLVDHDSTKLLGRTASGTLSLRSDSKGLYYEVQMPDTQLGRDTLTLCERGDISQSSFGFTVDSAPGSETWYDAQGNETSKWGGVRRVVRKVSMLFDVSPVQTMGAYPGATVQARNLADKGIAEARKFLQSCRQLSATDEAARQDGLKFLQAHKY
jgi:HK97 family phage prohead protease